MRYNFLYVDFLFKNGKNFSTEFVDSYEFVENNSTYSLDFSFLLDSFGMYECFIAKIPCDIHVTYEVYNYRIDKTERCETFIYENAIITSYIRKSSDAGPIVRFENAEK